MAVLFYGVFTGDAMAILVGVFIFVNAVVACASIARDSGEDI